MAIMERTPPPSSTKRRSPRKLSLEPSSVRKGGQQANRQTPTRAASEIPLHASSASKRTGQNQFENPFLVREEPPENKNDQQDAIKSEDASQSQTEDIEDHINPFGSRAVRGTDYDERPIKGSTGIGFDLILDDKDAFHDSRKDGMREIEPTATSTSPTGVNGDAASPVVDAFAGSEGAEDDFATTPRQMRVVREENSSQGIREASAARSTSTAVQPNHSQIKSQSQIPRAIHAATTAATMSNPFQANSSALGSIRNGSVPPHSNTEESASNTIFNPSASQRHRSTTPLKARSSVINAPMTPTEHYNPIVRAERVATLELVTVKKELVSLKKQLTSTERKLRLAEEQSQTHLTDAEGWRAECQTNDTNFKIELERVSQVIRGLEMDLEDSELYRKEARIHDESKLIQSLWLKEKLRDANCELVLARNEITYQTHRAIELEINFNEEKEISSRLLDSMRKQKVKIATLKAAYETKLGEKGEEIDGLNNTIVELQEELESIKEAGAGRDDELKNQVKDLTKSFKEHEKEFTKIRKELDREVKKSEKLEGLREEEEREKEELQRKIRDLEKKLASRPLPTSPSSPPPPRYQKPSSGALAKNSKKRKPESDMEEEQDDQDAEAEEFDMPSSKKFVNSKSKAAGPSRSQALPRKRRLVPMQGASDFDLRSSPPHPINKGGNSAHREDDEEEEEGSNFGEGDLEARNSPSPKKASSFAKSAKSSALTKAIKPSKKAKVSDDEQDAFIDESDKRKNSKGKGKAVEANARASATAATSKKKSLERISEVQATPMVVKTKIRKDHDETGAGGDQQAKKRKIKLLGGGGGISGWNADGGSKLDIPIELSPLKASNPHAMRPPNASSRLGFGGAGSSNNVSSIFGGGKRF